MGVAYLVYVPTSSLLAERRSSECLKKELLNKVITLWCVKNQNACHSLADLYCTYGIC